MKTRMIAAVLAAFFMLPFFGVAAYAAPIDDTPLPEEVTETEIATTDAPLEIVELHEETADISEDGPVPTTGGLEDFAELPPPPPGTGTVIDYSSDTDGTLFYTIMTLDEYVFYLVIDKNRNTDNVYFLNAVTVDDLLPLAQKPPQAQGGIVTTPPTAFGDMEQPGETPPTPEPEQAQSGGNMGTLIFVVVIVVLGGGAGWYFKIYRPKHQGAADGDEYDPALNGADNDYADDWGSDSDDGPALGEGADTGDDSE